MSSAPSGRVPDLLSATRPVLGLFILLTLRGSAESQLILPAVLVACATDFFDGPLARRTGSSGMRGRLIDNIADATFLGLVFYAFASVNLWSDPVWGSATKLWPFANWLPLMALVASFGLYSVRLGLAVSKGELPLPSSRGHEAGIANYGLAIVGGLEAWPGVHLTPWVLEPAFATVVVFNVLATVDNVLLLVQTFTRRFGQPPS